MAGRRTRGLVNGSGADDDARGRGVQGRPAPSRGGVGPHPREHESPRSSFSSPGPGLPGHLPAAIAPDGAILVYVGGTPHRVAASPLRRVRDRAIEVVAEELDAPAGAREIKAKDAARVAEIVDRLERLDQGRSTENIATRCPRCAARDLGRLTDDQLDTLEALEAIARGEAPTAHGTVGPARFPADSDPDAARDGKG